MHAWNMSSKAATPDSPSLRQHGMLLRKHFTSAVVVKGSCRYEELMRLPGARSNVQHGAVRFLLPSGPLNPKLPKPYSFFLVRCYPQSTSLHCWLHTGLAKAREGMRNLKKY